MRETVFPCFSISSLIKYVSVRFVVAGDGAVAVVPLSFCFNCN